MYQRWLNFSSREQGTISLNISQNSGLLCWLHQSSLFPTDSMCPHMPCIVTAPSPSCHPRNEQTWLSAIRKQPWYSLWIHHGFLSGRLDKYTGNRDLQWARKVLLAKNQSLFTFSCPKSLGWTARNKTKCLGQKDIPLWKERTPFQRSWDRVTGRKGICGYDTEKLPQWGKPSMLCCVHHPELKGGRHFLNGVSCPKPCWLFAFSTLVNDAIMQLVIPGFRTIAAICLSAVQNSADGHFYAVVHSAQISKNIAFSVLRLFPLSLPLSICSSSHCHQLF